MLELGIKEWYLLVEEFKKFEQIINNCYPQITPIFKYLDNEDLMKKILVAPPTHKVSQDVDLFKDYHARVISKMEENDVLFAEKRLSDLLGQKTYLQEFQAVYARIAYLKDLEN